MSDAKHDTRESVLLPEDHAADTGHVYDGIAELDHRLPAWWLMTLWGAIVFSVFYWAYYETTGIGPTQKETFEAEKAEVDKLLAAKEASVTAGLDDAIVRLQKDPDAIARGKAAYDVNCMACHRLDGGGLVGPNLTDGFSVHGHTPSAMFKVIGDGVLEKGMPAWKPVLGVEKVRDVVAYVLTMPPAAEGKAPQGDPTTSTKKPGEGEGTVPAPASE